MDADDKSIYREPLNGNAQGPRSKSFLGRAKKQPSKVPNLNLSNLKNV